MAGCAGRSWQTNWPDQLPRQADNETVPFFPQQKFHCGPAALATLLNFYDPSQDYSPDHLAAQTFTPGVKGTYALDMLGASRRQGFIPYPAPMELSSVLAQVAAGQPSIWLLNLGLSSLPQWHYAVLVGYDLDGQWVLMRSGQQRYRKMRIRHFEKARRLGGYWGIVPLLPDQLPNPLESQIDNQLHWQRIYQAQLDFSQVHPNKGLSALLQGGKAFPLQWQFEFAAGNLAFSLGQFSQAESHYRIALDKNIEAAEVWNNLAYVYRADRPKAEAAIRCALHWQPESETFRDSYFDLMGERAVGPFSCESIE